MSTHLRIPRLWRTIATGMGGAMLPFLIASYIGGIGALQGWMEILVATLLLTPIALAIGAVGALWWIRWFETRHMVILALTTCMASVVTFVSMVWTSPLDSGIESSPHIVGQFYVVSTIIGCAIVTVIIGTIGGIKQIVHSAHKR